MWLEITNADGRMKTFVAAHQVIYAQAFKEPRRRKFNEHDGMAYGEVIVPGGTFIIWNEQEAAKIWHQLRISYGSGD